MAVHEEIVVIAALSKLGQQSGFELRQISEIVRLEVDGPYERKVERLSATGTAYAREARADFSGEIDPIDAILEASHQDQVVVTVWGDDDEGPLTGVVAGLEAETVEIELLDPYGRKDGTAYLSRSEVTAIDFNGISEQVLRFLSDDKPDA